MKFLELVFDERYGRDLARALVNIQAAAEVRGVPAGTKPDIELKENPEIRYDFTTVYRWEWEE